MAANMITVLGVLPWGTIADKAIDLISHVRSSKAATVEPPSGAAMSPGAAEQITRLDRELAEANANLARAGELIQAIARENEVMAARIVAHQRWLVAAALLSAIALIVAITALALQ